MHVQRVNLRIEDLYVKLKNTLQRNDINFSVPFTLFSMLIIKQERLS